MSLMRRGALFAGALYAGLLFGPAAQEVRQPFIPDGQDTADEYTLLLEKQGREGLAAYVALRDAKRLAPPVVERVSPTPKEIRYEPVANFGERGIYGLKKPQTTAILPSSSQAVADLEKQIALLKEEEDIAMILMLMSA